MESFWISLKREPAFAETVYKNNIYLHCDSQSPDSVKDLLKDIDGKPFTEILEQVIEKQNSDGLLEEVLREIKQLLQDDFWNKAILAFPCELKADLEIKEDKLLKEKEKPLKLIVSEMIDFINQVDSFVLTLGEYNFEKSSSKQTKSIQALENIIKKFSFFEKNVCVFESILRKVRMIQILGIYELSDDFKALTVGLIKNLQAGVVYKGSGLVAQLDQLVFQKGLHTEMLDRMVIRVQRSLDNLNLEDEKCFSDRLQQLAIDWKKTVELRQEPENAVKERIEDREQYIGAIIQFMQTLITNTFAIKVWDNLKPPNIKLADKLHKMTVCFNGLLQKKRILLVLDDLNLFSDAEKSRLLDSLNSTIANDKETLSSLLKGVNQKKMIKKGKNMRFRKKRNHSKKLNNLLVDSVLDRNDVDSTAEQILKLISIHIRDGFKFMEKRLKPDVVCLIEDLLERSNGVLEKN